MGLLDDAIREHLNLKRRHGADPAEIERAEREALGPVRRGPEVAPDVAPAEEFVSDRGLAYEDVEHDWEEPVAGEAPAELYDTGQDLLAAGELEEPSVEKNSRSGDERGGHLYADAPPEPRASPEPPPRPPEVAGQETEEYEFEFDEQEPEQKRKDTFEKKP
jgi:hypothetical protein